MLNIDLNYFFFHKSANELKITGNRIFEEINGFEIEDDEILECIDTSLMILPTEQEWMESTLIVEELNKNINDNASPQYYEKTKDDLNYSLGIKYFNTSQNGKFISYFNVFFSYLLFFLSIDDCSELAEDAGPSKTNSPIVFEFVNAPNQIPSGKPITIKIKTISNNTNSFFLKRFGCIYIQNKIYKSLRVYFMVKMSKVQQTILYFLGYVNPSSFILRKIKKNLAFFTINLIF